MKRQKTANQNKRKINFDQESKIQEMRKSTDDVKKKY